jgi:hypothetical protein
MCAQTNRLRIYHKSACVLQPILGNHLEYDCGLLRVWYGSVLCKSSKFDNCLLFIVKSRLLGIHLCWVIVTGAVQQ